jgi:hypothetical protein
MDMAWYFTRIPGLEPTSKFRSSISYAISEIIEKGIVFDWGEVISEEVSHQLSVFQDKRKMHITSYVIYALVFHHEFTSFPKRPDITPEVEYIQLQHPKFWV